MCQLVWVGVGVVNSCFKGVSALMLVCACVKERMAFLHHCMSLFKNRVIIRSATNKINAANAFAFSSR